MRLRLNHLSVIPAVLVILGTAGSSDLLAQSGAAVSARGHVDIEVNGFTTERYSFTARQDGEAPSARGQFQLFTNLGTEDEVRAHGEVTCMTVLEDGTTLLGGRITNREPALMEGQPAGVFWLVRDDGEGRNAQDTGSLMQRDVGEDFLAFACTINLGVPPLPSVRGNVQVSSR